MSEVEVTRSLGHSALTILTVSPFLSAARLAFEVPPLGWMWEAPRAKPLWSGGGYQKFLNILLEGSNDDIFTTCSSAGVLLLLYSFHPVAEITLKNVNIKDEFKGASTRIN